MFAAGNVFAATKFSDLALILPAVSDQKADVYDVEGRQYVYNPEKHYIAPTFTVRKISKKALLDMTLTCTNLKSTDFPTKTKSLGNILYPEFFRSLAKFIKAETRL
jgi:hypothetical protein